MFINIIGVCKCEYIQIWLYLIVYATKLVDQLKKASDMKVFKSLLSEKIPASDLPQLFPTLITEQSPTNLTASMYLHLYNELLEQKRKAGILQEAGRTSHSDLQHYIFHIDEQFKLLEKQKPPESEAKPPLQQQQQQNQQNQQNAKTPLIRRLEKWNNLRSDDKELLDEFDPDTSYNFIIPPGQISCFSETTTKDKQTIRGAYYVTSGEDLRVSLKVTNHLGNVLYDENNSEQVFKYTSVKQGDRYEFCFSNSPYSSENRVVTFGLSTRTKKEKQKESRNNPLEDKLKSITSELDAIAREQNYMGLRHKRHQSTQESTNKRLNGYTLLEGFTYFIVCFVQICYLQSLVARKSRGILG